jgi:transcriptional regulator with XRE-family HTH domain
MQQRHVQVGDDRFSAAQRFGAELTRLRTARGASLRRLARVVGMTAHSALVDYERGLRVPPEDLVTALVTALRPETDELVTRYRAAVAERLNRHVVTSIRAPAAAREPAPPGTTCTHCGPAIEAAEAALEQAILALRGLRGPHSLDDDQTG